MGSRNKFLGVLAALALLALPMYVSASSALPASAKNVRPVVAAVSDHVSNQIYPLNASVCLTGPRAVIYRSARDTNNGTRFFWKKPARAFKAKHVRGQGIVLDTYHLLGIGGKNYFVHVSSRSTKTVLLKPGESCGSAPSGAPVPGDVGSSGDRPAVDINDDGVISVLDGCLQVRAFKALGNPLKIGGVVRFGACLPDAVELHAALLNKTQASGVPMLTGQPDAYSYVAVSTTPQDWIYLVETTPYFGDGMMRVVIKYDTGRGVIPYWIEVDVGEIIAGNDHGQASATPEMENVPEDDSELALQSNEHTVVQMDPPIYIDTSGGTLSVPRAKSAIKQNIRTRYPGVNSIGVRSCMVLNPVKVNCAEVGFTIPKANGTDYYNGSATVVLKKDGPVVQPRYGARRHSGFRSAPAV